MELLVKESYLAMIQNSVGSKLFRNLYANVDGKRVDILRDGDLSCALFVSVLLHQFKLIESPHATVAGLLRDMERSEWISTDMIFPGAVVIWEEAIQKSGERHAHSGFALSKMSAVSHSDVERAPVEHHITFGTNKDGSPKRKILATYTLEGFL